MRASDRPEVTIPDRPPNVEGRAAAATRYNRPIRTPGRAMSNRHDSVLRSAFPAVCARAAIAVACLLSLAACGKGDAPAGDKGGGKDKPVAVVTMRVQPQAFSDDLVAIGTVKAHESVTVTAKVSELVQQVHFESGQAVRAGAPLVTLSDRQQQAALAEAVAAADDADRLYRRQNELVQQQLISRSQFDTQRAARDAAHARVAQIRAQLGDRVVRAPFAGVLGIRQLSPGALVTPGTAIATLDDISRVYVDFPLPEAQLGRATPGQAVRARVEAYPDRPFAGNVQVVDARIDPATRAVQVRADLPNPDRLLRPGMLVNVELAGAAHRALLVPEIAVNQNAGDSFVFRVGAGDQAEQAKVRLGARRDGMVEIVSGLAAGDRIVIDGVGKLRPGAKVSEAAADRPDPGNAAAAKR